MSEGLLSIIPTDSHEEASAVLASTLIESFSSYKKPISLGLAGGETPSLTYSLLSESPKIINTIDFWLTDERWVNHESGESNIKMIKESFNLENLNIIHPHYSGTNPELDAEWYTEKLLSNIHRFTHAILGVGEDGHTASLFPSSSALEEDESKIISTTTKGNSMIRLTATMNFLAKVENVYLLVTGENKKNIVTEIVKNTGDLPINKLISLREETTLITDQV